MIYFETWFIPPASREHFDVEAKTFLSKNWQKKVVRGAMNFRNSF